MFEKKAYLNKQNRTQKNETWKTLLAPYTIHKKDFDPTKAALLVLDLQNYFLDPHSHAFVPVGKTILENTKRWIEYFRKIKKPVVFTQFQGQGPVETWWGQGVKASSTESELDASLKPQDNELVLKKSTYSAFSAPELFPWLQAKNTHQVLITGLLTHLCCNSTARAAFDLGLDVFFGMDSTGTWNEDLHTNSLREISHGLGTLINLEDL